MSQQRANELSNSVFIFGVFLAGEKIIVPHMNDEQSVWL